MRTGRAAQARPATADRRRRRRAGDDGRDRSRLGGVGNDTDGHADPHADDQRDANGDTDHDTDRHTDRPDRNTNGYTHHGTS